MSKKYIANDYLDNTVKYLRRYRIYKTMLINIESDIQDLTKDLQSESIKTAGYGEETGSGGGSPEMLTATERAADRRLALESEKQELLQGVAEIRRIVERIDRALLALPKDERDIVEIIHFDKAGYSAASRACCFSERHCGRLLRNAERRIAYMLFGPVSTKSVHFMRVV